MAITEDDRATLSAYMDGELDEAVSQDVEARLNLDAQLRGEYETLRHAWSLLDYLPRATPRVGFTDRTLQRLSAEHQSGPARRLASRVPAPVRWAAAVLLACGVGYALGGKLPTGTAEGAPAENTAEADEVLVRHLRVIEMWPLYQQAEDLDFLRKLDEPELFGEEPQP